MRDEQNIGFENKHNEDNELYYLATYQSIIALMSAKMWLGKMLEGRGLPFPKELADKAE